MKTNKKQTTKTNEDFCELSSEELGKIHRKYHPMENNQSYKVDDDYMKRFEKIFGAVTR